MVRNRAKQVAEELKAARLAKQAALDEHIEAEVRQVMEQLVLRVISADDAARSCQWETLLANVPMNETMDEPEPNDERMDEPEPTDEPMDEPMDELAASIAASVLAQSRSDAADVVVCAATKSIIAGVKAHFALLSRTPPASSF